MAAATNPMDPAALAAIDMLLLDIGTSQSTMQAGTLAVFCLPWLPPVSMPAKRVRDVYHLSTYLSLLGREPRHM